MRTEVTGDDFLEQWCKLRAQWTPMCSWGSVENVERAASLQVMVPSILEVRSGVLPFLNSCGSCLFSNLGSFVILISL